MNNSRSTYFYITSQIFIYSVWLKSIQINEQLGEIIDLNIIFLFAKNRIKKFEFFADDSIYNIMRGQHKRNEKQ